jgi:hypothetical protein
MPITILAMLCCLFAASGCSSKELGDHNPSGAPEATQAVQDEARPGRQRLANPASLHCVDAGGSLQIRTRPDGGQYGVCLFEDNRQCEEWALFRGECPVGGVKITGYDSESQVYCAITGGKVEMQRGDCLLPNGRRCTLETHFAGHCPKAEPTADTAASGSRE